jgi:hypothetical protein
MVCMFHVGFVWANAPLIGAKSIRIANVTRIFWAGFFIKSVPSCLFAEFALITWIF